MLDLSFEDDPGLVVSSLEAELLSKRPDTRRVLVQARRLVPPQPIGDMDHVYSILDSFVSQLGCAPVGGMWLELEGRTASQLLARAMARDLAYGIDRMKESEATDIARRFLDIFPEDSHYFTNGNPGWLGTIDESYAAHGWHAPLLSALEEIDGWVVSDTGIMVLDPEYIGMLWIADSE